LHTVEAINKNLSDGAYNFWGERISKRISLPYENVESIGNIFFYLINPDNQSISYKKFHAKNFTEDSNEWQFEQFIVDDSVGQIKRKRNGGII